MKFNFIVQCRPRIIGCILETCSRFLRNMPFQGYVDGSFPQELLPFLPWRMPVPLDLLRMACFLIIVPSSVGVELTYPIYALVDDTCVFTGGEALSAVCSD